MSSDAPSCRASPVHERLSRFELPQVVPIRQQLDVAGQAHGPPGDGVAEGDGPEAAPAVEEPADVAGRKRITRPEPIERPKVVNGIFAAAVEGDFDGALALQREANEPRKLTGAGIPVPFYHTTLRYRGIDIGVPKCPLLPKSAEEEAAIFKALDGYRHFE